VMAALLGFVVLIFSCGAYCSYLLLSFFHGAGLGSVGCRGSSSMCSLQIPRSIALLLVVPVAPVFRFVAIAIFTGRSLALLLYFDRSLDKVVAVLGTPVLLR
jgi:hypothetical protein